MVQDNLFKYVADSGVKQKAIANACGMTEMAVSNCARGERKLTANEFASVCKFLGKPMEFFRSYR